MSELGHSKLTSLCKYNSWQFFVARAEDFLILVFQSKSSANIRESVRPHSLGLQSVHLSAANFAGQLILI